MEKIVARLIEAAEFSEAYEPEGHEAGVYKIEVLSDSIRIIYKWWWNMRGLYYTLESNASWKEIEKMEVNPLIVKMENLKKRSVWVMR